MSMKNRWHLIVVILFCLSGCTARHVVVLPREAKGLSDSEWKILQEPSVTVEQPGIMEEKKEISIVE